MSRFRVAGYWTARKENLDLCGNRLQQFLNALSKCDRTFANWYEKRLSRRNAKQSPIDWADLDSILQLLEKGRHRRDSDNGIVEDLGFCVSLWNGEKSPRMVGLTITSGLYATIPGLGGNSVLLNLPEELGGLEQSYRMQSVLTAFAKCWEPDWAGVFSLDAIDSRAFNTAIPFVDWMLYLNHKMWRTPRVADSTVIQEVDDIGCVIIVESQPPRHDDVDHIRKIKEIELAIGLS